VFQDSFQPLMLLSIPNATPHSQYYSQKSTQARIMNLNLLALNLSSALPSQAYKKNKEIYNINSSRLNVYRGYYGILQEIFTTQREKSRGYYGFCMHRDFQEINGLERLPIDALTPLFIFPQLDKPHNSSLFD
jgi:hypothetical protein